MEIEENYLLMMEYPVFEEAKLNEEIKKQLIEIETSFKNEAKESSTQIELNITYQSYIKENRYISIVFDIYKYKDVSTTTYLTIVYDLKQKVFLDISQLFDQKAIYEFSTILKKSLKEKDEKIVRLESVRTNSAPIAYNFRKFSLTKEEIIFYFDSFVLFEDAYQLKISYEKIENNTVFNKESASVFVPYDQVLNEPVKNIDPNKKMIALTFDDGPSKNHTEKILNVLKEANASATFFILGSQVHNAPYLLQRMVLEGNEIGNHTYTHKQLTTLSKAKVEEEIYQTQEAIYEVTHQYPSILRPPYGSHNDMVNDCAKETNVVTWSIDTEDWRSKNADAVVKKVLDEVEDGSIILFHDIFASTAEAIERLVPKLQEMDYQLVTVSELEAYHKGNNHIFTNEAK